MLLTQFIGLGLGVAVVIDATIVRVLLVPAIMGLAGRWNWWPAQRGPHGAPAGRLELTVRVDPVTPDSSSRATPEIGDATAA